MLKAGAGSSTSPNAVEGAREAAHRAMERLGETRADLVVAFLAGVHRAGYSDMLRAVQVTTGCGRITGGSGLGIIANEEEIERGPGVAVLALSGAEALHPFLLPALDSLGDDQGRHLAELVAPLAPAGSTVALFGDPFAFSPPAAFAAFEKALPGIPLVGGLCSGLPMLRQTWQLQGTRAETGAVAGLVVPPSVTATLGVAQGCRPIGKTFAITKGKGNVIVEIGGRRALDVLKESVSEVEEEGAERVVVFLGIAIDPAKHPLGRGDFVVRHLVGHDPDSGAIAVAEPIRVGQSVRFQLLDTEAARDDMRLTLDGVQARLAGRRPAFGIYVACLGRGEGLFREPHHDARVIRAALGDVPLVGFFGNGEIAPVAGKNLLHSYTGALLVVSE